MRNSYFLRCSDFPKGKPRTSFFQISFQAKKKICFVFFFVRKFAWKIFWAKVDYHHEWKQILKHDQTSYSKTFENHNFFPHWFFCWKPSQGWRKWSIKFRIMIFIQYFFFVDIYRHFISIFWVKCFEKIELLLSFLLKLCWHQKKWLFSQEIIFLWRKIISKMSQGRGLNSTVFSFDLINLINNNNKHSFSLRINQD